MRNKVTATMNGAISIVNAVATGNGSALGISLKVMVDLELKSGYGIECNEMKEDRLVRNILYNTLPKEIIDNNLISINIKSEIPRGFGLKSSSAVSNAISLACNKLVTDEIDDQIVLNSAINASLDAKITVTGAYDDSAACYFGGFVVTDNYARRLIRRERAPDNLHAIIFIPQNILRGNISKLSVMSELFTDAFKLAESGEYWKAMKLNGILLSAALSSRYEPILSALEKGALAAGISGNGPSMAAVAYEDVIDDIKSAFAEFDGIIIVSKVNNQKACVKRIVG
jgi:shikimate kinase